MKIVEAMVGGGGGVVEGGFLARMRMEESTWERYLRQSEPGSGSTALSIFC